MESLLRLGAGVHRRAWTVRSSKSRAAGSSVRSRRPSARPRTRGSTHGCQQIAGNAMWRREAGTASRSRARRRAVAGVATVITIRFERHEMLKVQSRIFLVAIVLSVMAWSDSGFARPTVDSRFQTVPPDHLAVTILGSG